MTNLSWEQITLWGDAEEGADPAESDDLVDWASLVPTVDGEGSEE